MNSQVFTEAINFARTHEQVAADIHTRDNNPDLVLISIRCNKTPFEGGQDGNFLRIIFDYKRRGQPDNIGPDVIIDMIPLAQSGFRVLPRI